MNNIPAKGIAFVQQELQFLQEIYFLLQEFHFCQKNCIDWEEVTYNMKEIPMTKLGNFNMR